MPRLDASMPRDAGPRDGGGDAGAGDAGTPNGPTVEVLEPEATSDPSSPEVVIGTTLKVRCGASKSARSLAVDPESVKVHIYALDNIKPVITAVASSTSETGVFEADVVLAAAPHGTMRIECQASDVAATPGIGVASITTLHDRGPDISFLNPTPNGFVAAGTGVGEDVRVRFRVAPRPLAAGDTGGSVSELTVHVNGKPFPAARVEKSASEADVYSFGLDFSDSALFTIVPDTLTLRVTATTPRLVTANAATQTVSVGVDSEGPTIVVKQPTGISGQLPVVSGKVDVILEVTDKLAGVDPSSIVVRIPKNAIPGNPTPGNDEYPATPTGTMNQYAATFETGSYPDRSNLSITVVASDKVNNRTQSGFPVDVDTVPPWLSLDPPTVREKTLANLNWQCSGVFDPLGDAVNSDAIVLGQVPGQGVAFRPRVLIWDRPLEASNQTSRRYAMINNLTPRLYIQHNNDTRLLIDSDNDPNHYCDKINDSLADVTKAPVTITLSPVTPIGTPIPAGSWGPGTTPNSFVFNPDWSADPSGYGAPACSASIQATLGSPRPVSEDTTITRVIRHTVSGGHAAVYADSPTAAGTIRSTGKDYVSPGPGWVCMVATAVDNAGNLGFSEPMRVCTETTQGACASVPPPDCTDGCVIPDHFLRSPVGAIKGMPRILINSN